MALIEGAAGTLYHGNLKINTDQKGFNFKFHLVGASYDVVRTGAIAIASQMKGVLPTDSEIVYATMSKDNTERDSQFIRDALGSGTFGQTGDPLPAKPFDNSRSALLVRFENAEGQGVSRKINPIPDEVMSDGLLLAAIADITGTPVAAPAAAAPTDTYAQAFAKLLGALMFYSVYVKTPHAPGGAFLYGPWKNAYVLRQVVKKGGRVFAS